MKKKRKHHSQVPSDDSSSVVSDQVVSPENLEKIEDSFDAESEYLKTLNFDESTRGSWIETFFKNARFLVLLMVGIIVAGVFGFVNIARELNPEVVIPAVNVVTALPGASPRDVEELVSKKIEGISSALPNLDTYTSSSTQGVSVVTFQFISQQDPDEAAAKVKDEVDLIISDLPDDATEPKVQKVDINDQPFLTIGLVGTSDVHSISQVARQLQEKLEKVSGISKVTLFGQEEEELVVEINPDKLKQAGVSESQVMAALRSNNSTVPSGSVTIDGIEYTVSVTNELVDLDAVRSVVVQAKATPVTIGQVATVFFRSKEKTVSLEYASASDTQVMAGVQLSIYKGDSTTITDAEQRARAVIKETLQEYPHLQAVDSLNLTTEITETFSDLQGNFASSISLMFIVLLVFLGLRQASIAASSIPLVLASAVALTYAMGLSLNFLTLFSFLLALSLIGDDAIVMAEATTEYNKKFAPLETGLMVFRDFFRPIWVGTLTVVWSFVPLLLASGIIGEFIKPIPLVVTATLLSSTAIATLINLPLNIIFLSVQIPRRVTAFIAVMTLIVLTFVISSLVDGSPLKPVVLLLFVLTSVVAWWLVDSWWSALRSLFSKLSQRSRLNSILARSELISLQPLVRWYRKLIQRVVHKVWYRRMIYAMLVILFFISGIFVQTGLLKTEFFPGTDQDQLYINVEGPAGWQLSTTQEVLHTVYEQVKDTPEAESFFLSTGRSFSADRATSSQGTHVGYMTIVLKDPDQRQRTSLDIAAELRKKVALVQSAKVSVVEVRGGPPAGADVQVNIRGESLAELEKSADQVSRYLSEIKGVLNVSTSLQLTPGQLTVRLKNQELGERGLTAQQVGIWLRTALSGTKATNSLIDQEDTDITVVVPSAAQDITLLNNLMIPGPTGSYTLSEVAQITLENSPQSIRRQDGERVISVSAGVDTISGVTTDQVLKELQDKLSQGPLPKGYVWDVGGVNEENEKSVASIIQAMGVSFFLILITMVMQLHSFRKAALVMVVIPLAMMGVVINFTLFSIPLSFPALIGVLSLFGIVVNNALMVMEKVNLNLEAKFPVSLAVIDGVSSRVPAIFLSSLSSVVGLLPVTISDPLWRGLGGAIIAGLSVSGFLILFLLPALYVSVFGEESA